MKLSITTRLTITFGALTALVFLPAGLVLYVNIASSIRAEGARNAEVAATNLAFTSRYQWDEDLMVQYKDGVAPLETLNLNAPHWAVVRGDGTVVRTHGIFERPQARRPPGETCLVDVEGEIYRVASVPLVSTQESFENLPEHMRASVREASPSGVFLRTKWESARYASDPRKGVAIAEVAMLEPAAILKLTLTPEGKIVGTDREVLDERARRDLVVPQEGIESLPERVRTAVRGASSPPRGAFLGATWENDSREESGTVEVTVLELPHLVELKLTPDGKVHRKEREGLDRWVPRDLVEMVGIEADAEDVSFGAWKAYRGQLIAVLKGSTSASGDLEVAVNRVGERFILDDDGNLLGPDPDSTLWMFAASAASPEVAATARLRFMIATGLPLVWGAVVFLGWYVTRRALSPVKKIVDTVERIELSRLDERLEVGEVEDELSSVSATVNRMLDRIEEGYQRERQFTGDASHELRGPLAKVIADIDVALSQDRGSGDYRETLLRCRRYAERMQHLVESLLWLARLDARGATVNSRPFDLTDLLTEVVRAFPAEEASRVRLDIEPDERAVSVLGDPGLIRVMLRNLVQNALRYSSPGDSVEIQLGVTNGLATIRVEDHGEGINDDELERVFSRFYRVDKSRSRATGGFGLGLSIVDEIARAHGFRVSLLNAADGGLVASFSLPTEPEERRDG